MEKRDVITSLDEVFITALPYFLSTLLAFYNETCSFKRYNQCVTLLASVESHGVEGKLVRGLWEPSPLCHQEGPVPPAQPGAQ